MAKYLVKQWNTYYAEMRIPKAVAHFFNKAKFSRTLKTDSLEEAEIRKLQYIAQWKSLIKAAKRRVNQPYEIDFDLEMDAAKALIEEFGSGEVGMSEVAIQLDPDTTKSFEEQKRRAEVYGSISKKGTVTKRFVDEWSQQAGYRAKSTKEANKFVKEEFCKRFPVFEIIERKELRLWVEDQLQGRNGYEARSVDTVKKRLGWVNSFWDYCEGQYTDVECMTRNVMPKAKKTRASAVERSYQPYTVEEYWKLIEGADQANRGRGDPVLKDLMIVAAHTGCRLSELCDLRLDHVGPDRLEIAKSKTDAGIREIPIHKDIQQIIERLKQTSIAAGDEYLFSELTSKNQYEDRSNAVGKRFGRLKSKLGFDENYGFHSFRSTLAHLLEAAGVAENFAARIIGHKVKTLTYGLYSGDIPWHIKVETLAKISYRPSGWPIKRIGVD